MSKKNKGKNAFYFFMIDWKKEQEKLGKTYPTGLKDVEKDPLLSEAWKNLCHEKKAHYASLAKDNKVKCVMSCEKVTALGEKINLVISLEKQQQELHNNMLLCIQSVISIGKKHNSLDKLKFIFIHVNWFYKRDVGINKFDFCPAEFAVAEFSLNKCIENVYHEILNTKVQIGWRRDALEMSNETHNIPIEYPDGQTDFNVMFNNLVKMLKSNSMGNKYPPLYTIKDMIPVVKSLLERMCNASNGNMDDFVIYPLEALFAGLRNVATEDVCSTSIPLVVAENEFGKDIFDFTRGFECEFHKIMDVPKYCSRAIIHRWGFTICDYCCEYLNIQMIDGVHRPMPQLYFNETRKHDIDLEFSALSINKSNKILSMTGVSSDHRERVSERSKKDEELRRNQGKELKLIDHSKCNSENIPIIPGRPLRPPKTVAKTVSSDFDKVSIFGEEDTNIQKFNALNENFPPLAIGRGKRRQK